MRSQLKGARKFRNQKQPWFVEQVLSDLTSVHLDIEGHKTSRSLVGQHGLQVEALIKQVLFKNYKLICSNIMQSKGSGVPSIIPMPKTYLDYLESNGVKVNRFRSNLLLYKYSLFHLIKGFLKALILLAQKKPKARINKPYVAFINLSASNIPSGSEDSSYDIITWYTKSAIYNSKIHEIWAQVKETSITVKYKNIFLYKTLFPKQSAWINYVGYCYKVLKAFFVTFFGMIQGKWWYGLLFDESIYLHYISLINDKNIAKEYLLHQSGCHYKPLWLYEVEDRGSIVSLYFYSTNNEGFKYGENEDGFRNDYAFKLMKWDNIIVWDNHQKDYLKKKYCPIAKYKVVGPIRFSDSDIKLNDYQSEKLVGIFDVTPARPILYTSLGYAMPPYYSTELSFKFFSDIASIKSQKNTLFLWKKKRLVGHTFINKGFVKRLTKYLIKKNIVPVNPDIAAEKIIEKCSAVISMPFTSTAIIAKKYQIPSIYYDPFGNINSSESHGVPVIKDRDGLIKWWASLNIN